MATKNSTGRTAASKTANRSTATKKKTAAKKKTSAGRKYSPEASAYVEKEMKEMKQGKLKSGGSGKKVRNPKQAVAIGLSEARKAGAKVLANPRRKAA
jgi:hypothetical protein